MVRVIPRRTKVKLEFVRGITGLDLIIAIIAATVFGLLVGANFFTGSWIIAIIWGIFAVSLFFKIADGERMYVTISYLLRFSMQKKKYVKAPKKGKSNINQMIPFESIEQDRFISFGDYYAEVLEVNPVLFGLLNEFNQDNVVNAFGNAIRRLTGDQTCEIVKINKAMVLDNFTYSENKKYDKLLDMMYDDQMSQAEVDARAPIFEERVAFLEDKNRKNKIYKDFFYLVVFDRDREALENTVNGMVSALASALTPVGTRRLYGPELAVFLRANYNREFDERELEGIPFSEFKNWATPDKIKFGAAKYNIDGKNYRTFAITEYPLQVGNAWGSTFFLLDRTKVVMKFKQAPKFESEKKIDKAIMDMETKLYKTGKSSTRIELETHLDTLKNLLVELKNNNQNLYDVNTFITCEDSARKDVKAILRQYGFRHSEMFARQIDAFISSGVSRRDYIKSYSRGIPTDSLAAVFPFVSSELQDPGGIYIGDNEYPVFVDFFKHEKRTDPSRVNANMMIIGKSGSGKSFATKMLLANFAADNAKIFILDPEKEYDKLTYNLKGKMIDVGSSLQGILNPFHVIRALDKDDDDGKKKYFEVSKKDDSFKQHLQFLEQFFRTVLEGIPSDAFEVLNSLVQDMYNEAHIDEDTDLKKLKPEDYPIFDDLYALILRRQKESKDEYLSKNLRVVDAYIKKFAKGGRNSSLWNGPTSIETNENFVNFNFQSLIASNNETVTNAQMLLVFKYLENEIINNKDYNKLHKTNRHIIIVVDEAHTFINPKYPIALNFMTSMAKRIRKYGGMQIIITQNINDFVGSEEIKRQSTAIINACQYSLIFSLAPNDVNSLIDLYKNSGGINSEEQNAIVTASVGQAFIITAPTSRTMVQISPLDYVVSIFKDKNE